jgi:acetylornithine deacetylase/succinyl-diaminopimelate desuccinylase-like protein
MEIDMRSASPIELARLENRMKEIASAAAEAENRARSTTNGKIELKLELLGDRPAGSMAIPPGFRRSDQAEVPVTVTQESPLVLVASEVVKAHGLEPQFGVGSTDANVPMSIGIPAITLSPGVGGRAHSLDEWSDSNREMSLRQLGIVLTTILAIAGARND